MSDNIPFDIQREIIKRVSHVKSLLQFRSVSKPWKSLIDSSEFINGYGARHKQQHSCILMHKEGYKSEYQYMRLDLDIETNKVQQKFIASPFFEDYHIACVVAESHGLLCLFCISKDNNGMMFVVWNPCIGKSFGIALPTYSHPPSWIAYGFGVCPVTGDPTLVKVLCENHLNKPWRAEVFTLSSGVWSVIPSSKLPRQSVILNPATQVVIDRFIYWSAYERTAGTINHMVVSFDMIAKKFKVVNLPDNVRNERDGRLVFLGVAKLRESLVVYGGIEGSQCCGVWVMENNSSFKKLFMIGALINKILGFCKGGEPIVTTLSHERPVVIYDPCLQRIKNLGLLGISAVEGIFVMDSYKESLLLLDHLDSHIYPYVN